MPYTAKSTNHLISVPRAMSNSFSSLYEESSENWFVASDPEGSHLGSGGGTAYLLVEAWRSQGQSETFIEWLRSSRKMVIHGGGRSRRLPAYAPSGKPFIPMPVTRTAYGERLDQKLIDFQLTRFHRLFDLAPDKFAILLSAGDQILDFDQPEAAMPEVDVLCFGMEEDAETAQDFGVFITDRVDRSRFVRMLQKPSVDEIAAQASDRSFYLDSGTWLLSEEAVLTLLRKSGWDVESESFPESGPDYYDLYGTFGPALGEQPTQPDPDVQHLTSSVYPLPNPSFLHLGTNRQLIESVSSRQAEAASRTKIGPLVRHPDVYIQNSDFQPSIRRTQNTFVWIENSIVPTSWEIAREHMLTGIPANRWSVKLEPGVCIDFVPLEEEPYAVRVYGFDDHWSGKMGRPDTLWLGRSAQRWLSERGITFTEAGIDLDTDIHEARLHPILSIDEIDGSFLEWMFSSQPVPNEVFRDKWLRARKISSYELNGEANLVRQMASRRQNLMSIIPVLQSNAEGSVFYRADLEATAKLLSGTQSALPVGGSSRITDLNGNSVLISKAAQFEATLLRQNAAANGAVGTDPGKELEALAFSTLRDSFMSDHELPVEPAIDVQDDQIVWGRSPIRLDIAGGGTDLPPYCLQHGGKVVNIAVDLNGQPPIQVYAKKSNKFEIVVRSIDLGVEQRLTTFDEVGSFAQPGSEFALAKAALALAGFHPMYSKSNKYSTLEAQLKALGSGLEISMMVAIPAGSGLGTSSILAATLLGTLSDLCNLNWTHSEIVWRALVLEQMLTTGGGWQDQVGGIYGGLKVAESYSGLKQNPIVRWLPDTLFSGRYANKRMLLYYTGITRLAKNIIHDMICGMFLNRSSLISCLDQMADNVDYAVHSIQLGDYKALRKSLEINWGLYSSLDPGTRPDSVEEILALLKGESFTSKLLGAGGGGYLLLLAEDNDTGSRIREILLKNPTNPRARFVDFSTSDKGLEVTRS